MTSRRSSPRRMAGFTLIEMLIALTIFSMVMVMLNAGLSLAARSWQASDRIVEDNEQRQVTHDVLYRELSRMERFDWPKGGGATFAFKGERDRIRFVNISNRNRGGATYELWEFEIRLEGRVNVLRVRRADFDPVAGDFSPLDDAAPSVLTRTTRPLSFSYLGAATANDVPTWQASWETAPPFPMAIRLRGEPASDSNGSDAIDVLVPLRIEVETACVSPLVGTGCSELQ